ncbi:MAG: hypothetical protein ACYTGL_10595 [Planctomycetota bacterium]|jgi:hypothetical protein
MKPLLTAALSTLLILFLVSHPQITRAQEQNTAKENEDAFDKAERERDEFKERVENRVLEEFRLAALNKMLLEIEELRNVCGLDAKAVKKLEIAAKGATERWIRNEEQQLRGHVRLDRYGPDVEIRVVGKKVPRPDEPEDEPDQPEKKPGEKPPVLQAINRVFGAGPQKREEKEFANITVAVQRYGLQFRVKRRNGSSSSGFGGGLEELKREAVWTKTRQAVITPEQQKQYEAAVEERRQRLREASIVSTIAQLDLQLRLDQKQRQQLRELFTSAVKPEKSDPNSVKYYVERQIKATNVEQLKPILSDAQLHAWKEYASW